MLGLAVGLVGLGAWRLDTVSGQDTLTEVVAPSSWPTGGGNFTVEIRIENVGPLGLGSYEWQLSFDPALVQFVGVADGSFLGSTGRNVSFCEMPSGVDPSEGSVRFGCATTGFTPAGSTGSGLLSTLTFSPVSSGASPLELDWVSLSDATEDYDDLPTSRAGACIAIGAGASCAAPTTAPPATATPSTGGTVAPTPTNTPTSTGPLPTSTPLPAGLEAVPLAGGCNPVTSTYPDASPIQTLADAVGPAGNLVSLWKFDVGIWRAYSPQYPQASDLTEADLLDVVFACVGAQGDFVRPII